MRASEYDPVFAGDEDGCLHDRGVTLVVPTFGDVECEGGQLLLVCNGCDQVLEEGVMYE